MEPELLVCLICLRKTSDVSIRMTYTLVFPPEGAMHIDPGSYLYGEYCNICWERKVEEVDWLREGF